MKILLRLILGLVVVLVLGAGLLGLAIRFSLPQLTGEVKLPGLASTVTVTRDSAGVPTITAPDRTALAMALGFIHGQERFFQMDLLRRRGAGEIAALVGPAAAKLDMPQRLHRMRARADLAFEKASGIDRDLAIAYTNGVNAGLKSLSAWPFEYLLLAKAPEAWRPQDSILVNAAMFFNLQSSDGWDERRLMASYAELGPEMSRFLYAGISEFDAPIDGSDYPLPSIPSSLRAAEPQAPTGQIDPPSPGSNNWAIDGSLSRRDGAAILANDMHLGLLAPNIWYRARLIQTAAAGAGPSLDIVGVTLPGTMGVLVGSNGHVAWGFTNSYIDTGDVIVLEPVDGNPARYQTNQGPRDLTLYREALCAAKDCPVMNIEDSIWGPVVGVDGQGRKLAYHWVGQAIDASAPSTLLGLEQAKSVTDALLVAQQAGIPNQNFVVADSQGQIGWTIAGRIPRRFGFDGTLPTSWADGTKGWDGYLSPEDVPAMTNPDGHRLWTANGRVVGGSDLAKLGDGGYAFGDRARAIRDLLRSKESFDERDLLAIQLDDHTPILHFWRDHLLGLLRARDQDPSNAAMIKELEAWTGRASVDSIGYRLIRTYRAAMIDRIYGSYTATMAARNDPEKKSRWVGRNAESAVRRLMLEQPAGIIPPNYKTWGDIFDGALADLRADVDKAGGLKQFSWGDRNRAAIHHPLSIAISALSPILDPPKDPLPGDQGTIRAQGPNFGASERLVVAPGHEDRGLFHMPTGQAGHPWSPYYNKGHSDWVLGNPTPLLPGLTMWTMQLSPGP